MATKAGDLDAVGPVIEPGYSLGSITDKISSVVLTQKTPRWWWVGLGIGLSGTLLMVTAIAHLLTTGVGV